MINALIAFNSTQINDFFDNFRFDEDGNRIRTDFAPFTVTDINDNEVTMDPYNIRDLRVDLVSQGGWKANEQGPNTTIMSTMHVRDVIVSLEDDNNPGEFENKLAMVEYLRDNFDARYQVMGCWYESDPQYVTSEGKVVMHGETITRATFDNEDPPNELTPETIGGKRTYPLNPNYLRWMPDDVEYDADGNEISRTPATEFKDVNLLQGHPQRLA